MTNNAPVSEDDLHAWADGRLDGKRRAEVEAWLADHPESAAALIDWRALNTRLHAGYDPVVVEAVPARLRAVVRAPRKVLRIAAAVGWIALGSVLGVGAGYRLGGGQAGGEHAGDGSPAAVARRAAVAHAVFTPEQRHPVEVGADQEQHLIAWLSKRLGKPLQVPDLSAHGYQLMGGRLLAAEAGPSAQFMYQNDGDERLTLYVSADPEQRRNTEFRFADEAGVSVFYWVDDGLAYALSGRLGRQSLLPAADTVYRQLTR